MADSYGGYAMGDRVEVREDYGSEWLSGYVSDFDLEDERARDDRPFGVITDKDGYERWFSASRIRKVAQTATTRYQFRRADTSGPLSRRKTSDWETLTMPVGQGVTRIVIPASAYYSDVEIRVAPQHTESEIMTEVKRFANSEVGGAGDYVKRDKLQAILSGEF